MTEKDLLLKFVESVSESLCNHYILMSPNSIGEVVFIAGLARAFVDTHKGSIALVIDKGKVPVLQHFPGVIDRVIPLDLSSQRLISDYCLTSVDKPKRGRFFNTYFKQFSNGNLYELVKLKTIDSLGGITLVQMFKHMLCLDLNCEFTPGFVSNAHFQDAEQFLQGLSIERPFALLNVGNNTNAPVSSAFWNRLASHLSRTGVLPVFNLGGARFLPDSLDNSVRVVSMPLHLFCATAELSDWFVSGGNGGVTFALVVTKNVRIDCITNDLLCTSGDGEFVHCHPKEQSHILGCPEIPRVSNGYYEWFLSASDSHDDAVNLADLVFRNRYCVP
jgi:hypothetical protein